MKQLNYENLRQSGYQGFLQNSAPERVLQFGEGNFLRAFVDYFIDVANEKCGFDTSVVIVQPIAHGLADVLNQQQGLYTLYLRGLENGKKAEEKRVVSCISRAINPYEDYAAMLACAHSADLRYIVSNTTEAGIVFDNTCQFDDAPPSSFPAKLTRFLYERYKAFGTGHGLVILSCELIDHNGDELRRCVDETIQLWKLGNRFSNWVNKEVLFCNTLVDRIVTGYPRAQAEPLNQENGYEDKLLDTGEVFGLWVIEGPQSLADELPFDKAGLPVRVVPDHAPYKQRKVRILNGAHTSMVMAAYLAGENIVRECMTNKTIRAFLEKTIHEEIIPTLSLPREELEAFARSVVDRFQNPFIDHRLLAIALNSTSKWRARVLPSLKGYVDQFGRLPSRIVFSFAAYLAFYRGVRLEEKGLVAMRGDEEYIVDDTRAVLELFYAHRDSDTHTFVHAICSDESLWGEDLSAISGFESAVEDYLEQIKSGEIKDVMMKLAQ
ncbi:MAG: tagaturonate reductase [Acetanaerobacterium sp.]